MRLSISYISKSGELAGVKQVPCKNKSGKYVVSKERFKVGYIYVDTLEEVIVYLNKGYKVRVSDPVGKSAPSLVKKESLVITGINNAPSFPGAG